MTGEKSKKPAKKTERAKRVTAYNIFVSRRRKQIVEERRKELEKVANDAKLGNGLDSEAPKDADANETESKTAVPEQRMAPDGTGKYTKEEFVEYYGGTAEWDAAVGTNTAASSEPTISFGSFDEANF